SSCVFFFQAEDGIRDRTVTGVQTCALPICADLGFVSDFAAIQVNKLGEFYVFSEKYISSDAPIVIHSRTIFPLSFSDWSAASRRSEERRVGKECRSWGSADVSKQNKRRR